MKDPKSNSSTNAEAGEHLAENDDEEHHPEEQLNNNPDDDGQNTTDGSATTNNGAGATANSTDSGGGTVNSGSELPTSANSNTQAGTNAIGERLSGGTVNLISDNCNSSCDSRGGGARRIEESNQNIFSNQEKSSDSTSMEFVNGVMDMSSSSDSDTLEACRNVCSGGKSRKHGVVSIVQSSPATSTGAINNADVALSIENERRSTVSIPIISVDIEGRGESESSEYSKSKKTSLPILDLEAMKHSGNDIMGSVVDGIIKSTSNENLDEDGTGGIANLVVPLSAASAAAAQSNLETIREGEVLEIPEEVAALATSASPPATVTPVRKAKFVFGDYSVSINLI